MASDMKGKGLARAELNPRSAFEIADRVAGTSADDTHKRVPKDAAQSVGLAQDEMIKGGPRGKIAKIAYRAESVE